MVKNARCMLAVQSCPLARKCNFAMSTKRVDSVEPGITTAKKLVDLCALAGSQPHVHGKAKVRGEKEHLTKIKVRI